MKFLKSDDEHRPFIADDNTDANYHSTQLDIPLSNHLAVDHPLTMSWQHINANVDVISRNGGWFKSRERVTFSKQLLYDVTGYATPGKIVAIMGTSGAGKTTLLNLLSGRPNKHLKVSGTICLNGVQVEGSTLMNQCGYIEQNELFIGTMTVREHLTFQAMLRMRTNTDQYRRERIDDVLQILDLTQCQNTLIGIPGKLKGISSGEFRRLTFGSVVLTNPALLLIDEPTSGLDSNLAQSIMVSIKRLASQGKTIITVLHQPSSQTFQMVDTLCLISYGHLVYFGGRINAPEFFASMNCYCPENYNPSEFYIEQLSGGDDDDDELSKAPIDWNYAVEKFQQSEYNQSLEQMIVTEQTLGNQRLENNINYQSNFFRQLKWLLWRSFRSSSRNPVHSSSLLFKSILPAIILGVLYFHLQRTPTFVQNLNAVSFVILTTVCYTNSFVVLALFPSELEIFLREHRRRLYGTSAYYIARFLTELPFFIFMPWLFTTIIYVFVGISGTFWEYLAYCLFVVLATNAATAFSGIIAVSVRSSDSAVALALPLLEIFMLFGGFFLNNASVPIYFLWLRYCTWYYYVYSLILIFLWRNVGYLPCDPKGFCLADGNDVLNYYRVNQNLMGFHLGMLVLLIFIYHLITFIIIWIRSKRS